MINEDAIRRARLAKMSFPLTEGSAPSAAELPSTSGETRPRDGLLHRIFEGQADARPRSVAVQWDERVTAYCVLEARANRFARHLRSRGVVARSLVALLVPRAPEIFVAVLGILKAGGAIVPLDPEWEDGFIAQILCHSGASTLVTTDRLARRHAGFRGLTVRIDSDRETILAQSPMRPSRAEVGLKAEDLCCVLYGRDPGPGPRGVMIEHRNAAHLARAERWLCSMRPDDRVYQGAAIGSGRFFEEMWLAFSAGAALVPSTDEMARSGPDLPQLLARRGVTVLSSVPTLVSMMEGALPGLRLLILGGESCPSPLVKRWARPGLRILNTYGTPEATLIAACGELRPGRPVTLGTAIPGARIYLMDDRQRPVARSAAGEICIAGGGVTRGYLREPEETTRRFLRDPFAPRDERPARLFRTGRMARLDWEGNLTMLHEAGLPGLPGFEGDPLAIESALLETREVLSAACGTREDVSGPRLSAYVVMRRGSRLDEAALRLQLRRRLPSAMVPRTIEAVRRLPILPGGGVDRRALTRPLSPAVPIRPESLERLLAVWGEMFRPRTVAPEEHFFLDLGGDALLAARLEARIRRAPEFAADSPIDIYRHPTVALLARALDAHRLEVPRREGESRYPSLRDRLAASARRLVAWLTGSRLAPAGETPASQRDPQPEEKLYDERGQGSVA